MMLSMVMPRGQALVEGVVGLSLLVVLFWAVPWVGRYLDLVDVLQHASRHAAFSEATQAEHDAGMPEASDGPAADFWMSDASLRWRTPSGRPAVEANRLRWRREEVALGEAAQPGQGQPNMAQIRAGWGLQDRGMPGWRASVNVAWLNPEPSESARLKLSRQTILAKYAGHSRNDQASSDRLAAGELAYAGAANASRRVGQSIATRVDPLEAGWPRQLPEWDWTGRWQMLRPRVMNQAAGGSP